MENTIIESHIQGLSTQRIRTIVESMGVVSISADTASRMAQELDQGIKEYLERPIEVSIVYLNVDAIYLKIRKLSRFEI